MLIIYHTPNFLCVCEHVCDKYHHTCFLRRPEYNVDIKIIPFNSVNVKLPISQLNKLKSAIKNATEVTLNLSSNMINDSKNETNSPHKLLPIEWQVSKFRKLLQIIYQLI